MPRERKPPLSDASAFRFGSAALGLICGMLIGLLSAFVKVYLFQTGSSFPQLVFGLGAIGALIGAVYPESAWALAEGMLHFLFGLSAPATDQVIPPNGGDAPIWLKVALWLGVALGVVVALFI